MINIYCIAATKCSNSKYDLDEVLKKSLLFYEAQRSGPLPSNNRVKWRKSAATKDRGNHGEDLSGGYFDGNLPGL